MSEAQSSSGGRRRRDFSLNTSVQNWSYNLLADHGKLFSLIFGTISAPTVKISTLTGNSGALTVKYMV